MSGLSAWPRFGVASTDASNDVSKCPAGVFKTMTIMARFLATTASARIRFGRHTDAVCLRVALCTVRSSCADEVGRFAAPKRGQNCRPIFNQTQDRLFEQAHRTSGLLSFHFHRSDGRFGMKAAASQRFGQFAGESGDP